MAGARFVRVAQRRPDLRFPFPGNFAGRLEGATIARVGRRAKYLLLTLSTGDTLVMHLGMSGRFSVADAAAAGGASQEAPGTSGGTVTGTGTDPKHDHVVFTLSTGAAVSYNDPRRFGFMLLIPQSGLESHALFASLGVEPLGNAFHPRYLAAKAQGRRVDLKAFLLDQRTLAGLGNIYVSEALHRAGLSPDRQASSLVRADGQPGYRATRLVGEIRSVLQAAIDAGGSSLRDYRHTDGTAGGFQNAFSVYGRGGEACLRPGCGGRIERTVQAQRATFACPKCQR